jgi:hypothetical protein
MRILDKFPFPVIIPLSFFPHLVESCPALSSPASFQEGVLNFRSGDKGTLQEGGWGNRLLCHFPR